MGRLVAEDRLVGSPQVRLPADQEQPLALGPRPAPRVRTDHACEVQQAVAVLVRGQHTPILEAAREIADPLVLLRLLIQKVGCGLQAMVAVCNESCFAGGGCREGNELR